LIYVYSITVCYLEQSMRRMDHKNNARRGCRTMSWHLPVGKSRDAKFNFGLCVYRTLNLHAVDCHSRHKPIILDLSCIIPQCKLTVVISFRQETQYCCGLSNDPFIFKVNGSITSPISNVGYCKSQAADSSLSSQP
jgi:hypothetical protein